MYHIITKNESPLGLSHEKISNFFIFLVDDIYPDFADKYSETETLKRLRHVTQFCGSDYTKIYTIRFLYMRYYHSLVVMHMTWHFTHDKKEAIMALLHDVGTPCFAHCIDYVFGDYMNQESSERNIVEMISQDKELLSYLKEDGLTLDDFKDYSNYHILENKSPKLCTDRLDGVLHTCYIWLHTHSLEQIKEVYDNIVVLKNEEGNPEIGFRDIDTSLLFVDMVYNYARELQGNRDKYIMKFVSEMVKLAFERGLITLDDLYVKREEEICNILASNFAAWKVFNETNEVIGTDIKPEGRFYISFETKKRNVIPLVDTPNGNRRIDEVSNLAKDRYQELREYRDKKYAYVKKIRRLD